MGRTLAALVLGSSLFIGCGSDKIPDRPSTGFDIRFEDIVLPDSTDKKAAFRLAYDKLEENWDYFQRQMSLVEHIVFTDTIKVSRKIVSVPNLVFAAQVDFPNTIRFRFPSSRAVVHELAHLWHNALIEKEKFDKEWKEISGGRYLDLYYEMANASDLENIGNYSKYSTRSIWEDVAETSEIVYIANIFPMGLRRFYKDALSSGLVFGKVVKKIDLLNEYGFFSSEEADTAIARLSKFTIK